MALLALLVIGVLSAGIWRVVEAGSRATVSREGTLQARLLAQAGQEHALSLIQGRLRDTSYTRLLRGWDNQPITADDGYLIGYLLLPDEEIPPEGRAFGPGTYHVRIVNDPADPPPFTDTNDQVLVRSTGTMPNGASATVETIVGDVEYPYGGFVTEDDLKINGNVEIVGECQAIHSNSELEIEGSLTLEGPVTASGPVQYDPADKILTPDGQPVVPQDGIPPRLIPDLDPMDYCQPGGDWDYQLIAGGAAVSGDGDVVNPSDIGWQWSNAQGGQWRANDDDIAEGTYCIMSNVRVSGNVGKTDGPLSVSIISTHSVAFTGTPHITADHDDGILILAGGDVSVGGNAASNPDADVNYAGSIYAGSHCEASGNVTFKSNFQCKGKALPPKARNYTNENRVSGNPTLTYDSCDDDDVVVVRQVVSWQQRFGFGE